MLHIFIDTHSHTDDTGRNLHKNVYLKYYFICCNEMHLYRFQNSFTFYNFEGMGLNATPLYTMSSIYFVTAVYFSSVPV